MTASQDSFVVPRWHEFVDSFLRRNPLYRRVIPRSPAYSPLLALCKLLEQTAILKTRDPIYASGVFGIGKENKLSKYYLYMGVDYDLTYPDAGDVPFTLPVTYVVGKDMFDSCSMGLLCKSEDEVPLNKVLELAIDEKETSAHPYEYCRTQFMVPKAGAGIRYALIPIFDRKHPRASGAYYTGMVIVPFVGSLEEYGD